MLTRAYHSCPSYSGSSRTQGAGGPMSGSSGSGTSNSTPAPMLEPPSVASSSRTGTPVPGSGAQVANANPLKPEMYSANPLFECLICSRQVGINRYAHHLAKCLGIGGKEKSARKNGNNSVVSDAGGLLQHSARIRQVLEARRRQRAPDAELLALKEMESNAERSFSKGKSECAENFEPQRHLANVLRPSQLQSSMRIRSERCLQAWAVRIGRR